MRTTFVILLGALLLNVNAQQLKIKSANTIRVDKEDTRDIIIQKAAHVVPTANQLKALQKEYIAFIHFGPNTFTGKEWGSGLEETKSFDLKELDTDQWCEAVKAAGMKMVIFTAKHHDGFVLWQSRYTNHGIMSTDFRDGKGDILKDLSESCRKYGLKLGIYLSPADLFHIEDPSGLYGNGSKYTKRTIPRQVPGRPFANKTTFDFELDDYNEYFLNQLYELLTEYGPVDEVWFDGAHPKTRGGQVYNYVAWKKLIKTLAPGAVIFGREDVRWCGNEAGQSRASEWNVIPYAQDPKTATVFPDMAQKDIASREQLYKAKYLHYQQAETNTSIREGWFYRDDSLQKVRSADDVFDLYERSVGGNSTFLLNIPPNKEGRFSPRDVAVLKEVGQRIEQTYGNDLLKGAQGPVEVLDGNQDTYLTVSHQGFVITLPKSIKINRLVIQEAITTHSERVEKHTLEAWIDGQWKEIARSTNIGYKRILRFADVTTDKLRLRFDEFRLAPAIATVSAHYYNSRPPRLSFSRSVEGNVVIEPLKDGFGWKAHGENVAANLSAGFKIYYTTDGSQPTANSTQYVRPFRMGKGELKAVAILNGDMGTVCDERFGLIKNGWKLLSASSFDAKHPATAAFDENPKTYWITKSASQTHSIAIDLGSVEALKGFAYTPQTVNARGLIAGGVFQVSPDGKEWQDVETFEFGNLKNDPTKRYHFLKTPVSTRYVRIKTDKIEAQGKDAAVAELDFF